MGGPYHLRRRRGARVRECERLPHPNTHLFWKTPGARFWVSAVPSTKGAVQASQEAAAPGLGASCSSLYAS